MQAKGRKIYSTMLDIEHTFDIFVSMTTGATTTDLRQAADAYLDALAACRSLPAKDGVALAQRAQREFAAIEATKMTELDERDRRRASSAGGTRSRKESSRAAKRSDAVDANPTLSTKLASGDIGQEQLDAIAAASEKSGGDAANDEQLLDDIENAKPDDAGKITRRWLEDREENAAQTRYDRQQKRRKVIEGHDPSSGCATLTLYGPEETISNFKQRIDQRGDEIYKADGGRDIAPEDHPRSYHQRLFDAASEIILGEGLSSSTPSAPNPRSMMHVNIVVDADAEAQIRATCPDGTGYLPDTVLERYACGSIIGGTVFNERGEVLWHGRQRRFATPAQFTALIARDNGCVLCGRSPRFCQAHHMMPFNAPAKGETNIDELALLCISCHDQLHDSKRTLIWASKPPNAGHRGSADSEGDGDARRARRVWSTRPATPEEIPPPAGNRAHGHNRATPETSRPGRIPTPARNTSSA